jgi:hypothetical protein
MAPNIAPRIDNFSLKYGLTAVVDRTDQFVSNLHQIRQYWQIWQISSISGSRLVVLRNSRPIHYGYDFNPREISNWLVSRPEPRSSGGASDHFKKPHILLWREIEIAVSNRNPITT